MSKLIKNATLIFPGHELNGKKVHVLVDRGRILQLDAPANAAGSVIDATGMLLFPSLVDLFARSGEPGYEDREDLQSLSAAAKAGGFGHVCISPETDPVIDSCSMVQYVTEASGKHGVALYPIGAISKGLKGTDLSEMYDMHKSGAVAFSDGSQSIQDVNLMKRALDYARGFDGLIMNMPHDQRIAPGGFVNESPANTLLGLKATPPLAEELMLNRDLFLRNYTQGKIHFVGISTAQSAEMVKVALGQQEGISASVSMTNLLFTEEQLSSFDTSFKVLPPLRSEKDRKALIKGLKKGYIDAIYSDHSSETMENKNIEFDHAAFGMTMLETFLPGYNMYLSKELTWDEFIHATSLSPRGLLGLPIPDLEEGQAFDFTLFNPSEEWEYAGKNIKTKGLNSPFKGMRLKGRVVAI